ncbi:MAG: thiamine-phosphate kinase [Myxococcales bacterium]
MAGEFERIAEIRRRLGDAGDGLLVGNGDDAAVLAASAHPTVVSVDTVVQGVHFDLDLCEPADVGYRAFAGALSDLAAMGASPRAAVVALIAPADMDESVLYGIADGFAAGQRDFGAPVVGGNLASGGELSVSTTVLGELSGEALRRDGVRPGDTLYVTGEVGAAAAGLQALLAGRPELGPECVARWRRPRPRLQVGLSLRGRATAAVDISDGLLSDLGHLAEASGVGFEVQVERLPVAGCARRVAAALGLDARTLSLTGGEDYELLFTAEQSVDPALGTPIGQAVAAPGLRLLDAGGRPVPMPARAGFDHFRRD